MKITIKVIIFFAFAAMGFLCGCGPTEADIITPQVKRQIEEHYKENGQNAVFVKTHSIMGSGSDFMIEAVISKNGKKYLTPLLTVRRIDDKVLITYPDSVFKDEGSDPSYFLTEL